MELARIFSAPDVQTERSIRVALRNNEETGLKSNANSPPPNRYAANVMYCPGRADGGTFSASSAPPATANWWKMPGVTAAVNQPPNTAVAT